MKFFAINKNIRYSGNDYVFERLKEFEELLPYLYKKIKGEWKLAFVDLTIEEVRKLAKEIEIPKHVLIEVYLKKDVLMLFFRENPSFVNKEKPKWEQYMGLIAEFPKVIDKRATSEIFKRCNGDLSKIANALQELQIYAAEYDVITISHVNAILLNHDVIYARDVVLTALLCNNTSIERRGDRLSVYRNGNVFKLYTKLEYEIGKEMAFYAMRKTLGKLFNDKVNYLNNKDIKDSRNERIVEIIDIYEITQAYMSFYLSNPNQNIVVLKTIIDRRSGTDLFDDVILGGN
jgi:hypothetical protein